jgi:hypothetical protein
MISGDEKKHTADLNHHISTINLNIDEFVLFVVYLTTHSVTQAAYITSK